MYVGEVRQVNFRTTPSDYDTTSLTWNSSDPTVISVTNLGKVTALKTGTSKISVSNQASSVSISCLVTVVPLIDSLKLGLIAYYPFNNSAVDSSGNGNNGLTYGVTPVTDRFGKENSAYYFNGTNSYIDVKDNQALRLSNTDFTINSWVNVQNYSPSYASVTLCKRGINTGNGWIASIGGQGNLTNSIGIVGTAEFNVSGGPDPFASGKIAVNLNQWHMVTISYSFQYHQMSIYIDGILDTVTNNITSPNSATATDMYIGADTQGSFNSSLSDYFFSGKLDDIRIYGRMLNTNEISKLYHLTH
ncbi:MAG: hypothetical protein NVSMB24_20130 [Mucilaginibacter sp.]